MSDELKITLSWEVVAVTASPEEERARRLLREATASKNQDPEGAIRLFLMAREQIAQTDSDHGIQVFVRLPRYLQLAGRSREGWDELNRLLRDGYPNMYKSERCWYHTKSFVYGKMRLFMQREQMFREAVPYGALAVIYNIRAQATQSTFPGEGWGKPPAIIWEEVDCLRERDYLSKRLTPLLKRADLLEYHDAALEVLHAWALAQPNADDLNYEEEFRNTLPA